MRKRLVAVLTLALAPALRAQGTVRELALHSATYGDERKVFVYTPSGYDQKKAGGYDLLVTFDGDEYAAAGEMGVPHILDSLQAAGAAPPFVAVMVTHATTAARVAELGTSPRYAKFIGEELIPWVRSRWNVTRDPHRTIITGTSAGGVGAAFIALARPDLFGNVLSQSGAVWRGAEGSNEPPYEYLTTVVANSPRRDVRFLLDVGSRETIRVLGGTGPVFIEANRRFREALRAKGYLVEYTEVPGGVHAMSTWRPRFAGDLVTVTSWSRRSPGEH